MPRHWACSGCPGHFFWRVNRMLRLEVSTVHPFMMGTLELKAIGTSMERTPVNWSLQLFHLGEQLLNGTRPPSSGCTCRPFPSKVRVWTNFQSMRDGRCNLFRSFEISTNFLFKVAPLQFGSFCQVLQRGQPGARHWDPRELRWPQLVVQVQKSCALLGTEVITWLVVDPLAGVAKIFHCRSQRGILGTGNLNKVRWVMKLREKALHRESNGRSQDGDASSQLLGQAGLHNILHWLRLISHLLRIHTVLMRNGLSRVVAVVKNQVHRIDSLSNLLKAVVRLRHWRTNEIIQLSGTLYWLQSSWIRSGVCRGPHKWGHLLPQSIQAAPHVAHQGALLSPRPLFFPLASSSESVGTRIAAVCCVPNASQLAAEFGDPSGSLQVLLLRMKLLQLGILLGRLCCQDLGSLHGFRCLSLRKPKSLLQLLVLGLHIGHWRWWHCCLRHCRSWHQSLGYLVHRSRHGWGRWNI